ncbi:Bcr/CflA family efflux MFS transporter [Leptobacterium flavescens]|uniref:Bcr/CflA family efflux MFS transporter n=1 Tax=Leptobacterium flavescens TaxID=472055 RepID=A0A6P0UT52_9FLAO|nr:multidrug effflux MFS transporter [Leptobacterium flavescens]NER13566.1 Bcr/CflA family efflux MFS transporter [Leptobacterium flavescens]
MQKKLSQFEFIALMASLMSIVALAIDALLPALDIIGVSIATTNTSDNQLLITMIFLGLGVGPLIFGPVSDSLGRKPVVYMGFALFIIASIICVLSDNLTTMVAGRILQGIGLSAPRTISIAMIRDTYSGDYMARIVSFVTVVFILVPIVAPAVGKFILDRYSWQAIFYVQLFFSVLVSFWFWKRQPETLVPERREKFTARIFTNGFKELIKYKITIAFTLISGFIVGSFLVYLSTSQHIFEVQYEMEDKFPYIFALLAISIGTATFLNGTLVLKYGMQKIISTSIYAFFGISLLYILLYHNAPNPPVWVLLSFFALQFFAIGFIFGNLRAMAMQPVGHIAGIAAAITGFVSTLMAVPISTYIGAFVTDSALPLFIGFLSCASISILILLYLKWDQRKVVLKGEA